MRIVAASRIKRLGITGVVLVIVVCLAGFHSPLYNTRGTITYAMTHSHVTPDIRTNGSTPRTYNLYRIEVNDTRTVSVHDARKVVLVTYQRSGSSFLGEIFNQNKAAFTWFEPLDGVYSALYGTEFGFNVPSDIWNTPSGAERVMPDLEVEAIAEVSKRILNCDMSKLPVEVLAHQFVGMFLPEHVKLKPYHDCISKSAVSTCKQCNKNLGKVCPTRFGSNPTKSDKCMNYLFPLSFPELAIELNFTGGNQDMPIKKAVEAYAACREKCRKEALNCVPLLEKVCFESKLRAIKPVRFPMESGKLLKRLLPELHIVHNLRDPRGVVHSRLHTSRSFQSLYSKIEADVNDVVKEAALFCRNAVKDVRLRRQIETLYPGSTWQMVYEHFAVDPLTQAIRVYSFIKETMPSTVRTWLLDNTSKTTDKQTQRNSKVTMAKWQTEITVSKMREIDTFCLDLYSETGHPWDYS